MIEYHIFQTYKNFLFTLSDQQSNEQNFQKSNSITSKRVFINETSKSLTLQHNHFQETQEKSIDSLSRKSSSLQRCQRIISNIIIKQSQCSFIIINSTRKTLIKKTIFSQLLKVDCLRVELNHFEMTAFFNKAQMTALQVIMQEIFQFNITRKDDHESNTDDNNDNSNSTDDELRSDFNF